MMNYKQYQDLFDGILNESFPSSPYDDKQYVEYAKLNQARMKRWDKTLQLSEELLAKLKSINKKQHWIIITEPWCGEAPHIIPFLIKMAEASEFISYELQLRDSEPFLISSYLTNGTKGIPKMIVRDENNNDLFIWGPRPVEAQAFRDELSAANTDSEAIKRALQQWYNIDKGKSLNTEILQHYS
jgi:hypothetical protein